MRTGLGISLILATQLLASCGASKKSGSEKGPSESVVKEMVPSSSSNSNSSSGSQSSPRPSPNAKPSSGPTSVPGPTDVTDATNNKTPPANPVPTPNQSQAPIPTGPTTLAVAVRNGPISFDLGTARPALRGAVISATATLNAAVGATPASLNLSAISVKSPVSTGMVLLRPVLVWSLNGKEQITPIGNQITLKVPSSRTVPLAQVVSVQLEGFTSGLQLSLRFSGLENLADASVEGIPNYRECKSPQAFEAVIPTLQPCRACHEGTFSYNYMGVDNATACGLNLKSLDATLSAGTRLPIIPTGNHNGANATATRNAWNAWKAAEGL